MGETRTLERNGGMPTGFMVELVRQRWGSDRPFVGHAEESLRRKRYTVA
jgi:hypothetical protein